MKQTTGSSTDGDMLTAKMENRLKTIQKEKRNYWKQEEELILKDWADKAQCYEWMHLKSHEKYKAKQIWFTIPVIVISTITGTANFAQERFGKDMVQYVVMIIGTLNLIAAIITTIYQFLKISELNEAYRASALSWGKYYRNIKTELLKHPLDRKSHEQIFKYASNEYDRLIEISPLIPKNIISSFNNKFTNDISFKKPEICTDQFGTDIYTMTDEERQHMVEELFEDENKKKQMLLDEIEDAKRRASDLRLQHINSEQNLKEMLMEKEDELHKREEELEHKNTELDEITKKLLDTIDTNNHLNKAHSESSLTNEDLMEVLDDDENEKKVQEFREIFLGLHGRYPDDDEIMDIMKLFSDRERRETSMAPFVNIDIDIDNDNASSNGSNSISSLYDNNISKV
jgi:hypothetical protein